MRILAILLLVTVSASACSDRQPADNSLILSNEEFNRDYVWSRVPADGWASLPTLVVAKRDGLYPQVPDVDIQLTCMPDGSLSVSGNGYVIATDVGGPLDTGARFSLRSNSVSLSGEPIWQHGSFSKEAHFILWPTTGQLSQLISGEWFEKVSIFPDGSGTVRYPVPPEVLAIPFLEDCGGLSNAQ